VEGPDIETRAEPLLRSIAEIESLELTDLVAEALTRPGNIPVNLGLDRRLITCAAVAKVGYALSAAPTFGVNAGVDHQADGTHQLQIEPSII
jgi:hypothetical protein